jgi:hypothetical protein
MTPRASKEEEITMFTYMIRRLFQALKNRGK